jgi:tRNA U34 5-methylaminomethyl-2-thiouridine-forming methyltransferase MnmC
MHVFINAGLLTCSKTSLTVFEAGFGTGLNAWLTFLQSLKNGLKIRYYSIEKYPLSGEIYESLNYPFSLNEEEDAFLRIHLASWNDEVKLSDNFILHKIQGDLTNFDFTLIQDIDLIYFDAFSPEKQPELWDEAIFNSLYARTSLGGKLVTYCAKGSVRRSLIKAGFIVERIPGPPGKREMLRAVKLMC